MVHKKRFGGSLALFLSSLVAATMAQAPRLRPLDRSAVLSPPSLLADDTLSTESRVAGDWRSGVSVAISGRRPSLPLNATDLGRAPSGARVDRMLLLLEPTAAQRQALDAELADQQDAASPEYHHWLTPATFAVSYANSSADVDAVVSWLQSRNFQVAPLPAGRGWIEFSGTASQVEQVFHTQVDFFLTPAGTRLALAQSISVPAALGPLIHGLVSLDGVVSTPALTAPIALATSAPELAAFAAPGHAEALTPQMVTHLLRLDAIQSTGATGAGETIAIPVRSNIQPDDVAAFRTVFGLPASAVDVTLNGPDPGRTNEEVEAVFMASWAGAAAAGAQIVLVPASTTGATDGIDLALAAIVDQSLAHTVAVGYSACEVSLSEAHQAFYAALYRQAAAQGIAVIAAAGDGGPSACHAAGSDAAVTTGYGVNGLASTPWNTAVGVAAFESAGSSTGGVLLAGWSPLNPADPAYAGGGGSSALYPVPAWQPLPAGKTTGAAFTGAYYRLLPDIALPTAIDSGLNRGLAFCLGASASAGGCTAMRSGGSSAAAALFAGIGALVAEKNGPQGNLAPRLYELSRQSGFFSDVQQGNARLSCLSGSPDCGRSGQIGFDAMAGYDLATGLGSVNAQKLVNEWARPEATGTGAVSVSLTVSPIVPNGTYNPSAQITFTATVISQTGGPTPSGTVLFFDKSTNANLSATPSGVSANGVASLTVDGSLAQGGNNITAVYSGDSTYASVTSQPLTVTTEPSTTSLTVVPATTTPSAGSTIAVTTNLTVGTPPAGTIAPAGKVTLNLDGLPTATASLTAGTSGSTASFSVTIPSAGVHTLQTVYAGDANYNASTSPAVTLTATKGATVTALTATPSTLTAGAPESFTATIAPVNAASGTTYSITGTVNFYDGATLLGTSVVNANTASLANVTLSPAVLHTITAVYSGDTSWATSTSNALALQSILLPDSVTLAVNITTSSPGQSINLVATVTPSAVPAVNTEQNPTGNVVFYDGTTVLGTVALAASLNYSSTATLITGALPGGQNVLTAVYVGDLYFAPGTSNQVTIDVQDFTIAPSNANSPTNLNIIKGSSGSASFVVTGLGGFGGQVQVVCAVPTQDDMTCSVSPQQVTPTATVTFTVQTYAAGGATTNAQDNHAPLWPRVAGGTVLTALVFLLLPIGRRAGIFAASKAGNRAGRFLILLLLLAGLGGAGIGCSSSVNLAENTGTPLGVSTLTITAASYVNNTVVSHSVYLTVNVLPPGAATSAQPATHPK